MVAGFEFVASEKFLVYFFQTEVLSHELVNRSLDRALSKETDTIPPVDYKTDRILSCVSCRVWSENIRNFEQSTFSSRYN